MNSEGLRVLGYLLCAGTLLWAWRKERPFEGNIAFWPRFWLWTGLLMLAFAALRGFGAADVLTGLGREEARAGGWYDARRGFQALAVAGLVVLWFLTTVVTIWRVPERRRRYLPAAMVVLFIAFFAAVRAISLHHVDQVLYNHPIQGVRIVVFIELGALALLSLTALAATHFRTTRKRLAAIEARS